jgi:hypothetical protein
MIVSHSRKFIFLKTRKTAGTSLEIALSKYCGPDDILAPIDVDEGMRCAVSGRGAQNYARPFGQLTPTQMVRYLRRGERVALFTEHMTAVAAMKRLDPEVWNGYFKFTIVRNPFDRLLSRFFWSMKARPDLSKDWRIETLEQYLRYRAEYVNENWLIYTRGDEILVDDVVRFESFESDLARISPRLGFDHNIYDDMKTIRAKGDFRPESSRSAAGQGKAAARIGPQEAAIIERLCINEIRAFNYDTPRFAA